MPTRWLNRLLIPIAIVAALSFPAAAQEFAERRALVIGINNYLGSDVPKLHYAERDAEHVAARLAEQGYTVTRLLGSEATRTAIVSHLVLAQEQLHADDSFVLYYAGHGVVGSSSGEVYWLNFDGEPKRPDVHGLRARHVIDLVREIRAGKKLILLDHCYAGSIGGGDSAAATAPAATGTTIGAREAFPQEFDRKMRRALGDSADEQRLVFLVAGSRGPAFEIDGLQHGLFSHVLLRALREASADTVDNDGTLSIGELTTFLKSKVMELANEKGLQQVPYAPAPANFDLGDGGRLQFFLRTLAPDEIALRGSKYDGVVRGWTNRQFISPQTLTRFEALLNRWKNPPPSGLVENDNRAVAAMRILIDSPSPSLTEADIARHFEQQLARWGDDL